MKNKIQVKRSSFLEGTFIATVAIVITKILGMLYVIPFYKMIGIKGSALYSYAYSIYVIFLDISTVGIPIAISKIVNEYNTLGLYDKSRDAYIISRRIISIFSILIFFLLFIFSNEIAILLMGDLEGGNTIYDVSLAIKCVSFAILVVPFLSVSKGYLQGNNVINVSSYSNILEQIVRISVILVGTYIVIYIFKGSVTLAVCVSLLGAFIGGIVSYRYVSKVVDVEVIKNIKDKEIVSKLMKYAIPFIIINAVSGLYNFVDMSLLLRTLNYLNLPVMEIEFVTSAVCTWAPKINMIVTSVAMGMTTSLIPSIVNVFTLGDWNSINIRVNNAISILIFISLPMSIGISMLSEPIWSLFYGSSESGSIILALNIFVGFMINIYMIVSTILQSLNKFKIVYLSTFVGFIVNILLDVPIMLLFYYKGIPCYLGTSVASIIGYLTSILIGLIKLKNECNLTYKYIFDVVKKLVLPICIMVFGVSCVSNVLNYDVLNKFSCILFIVINGIVGCVLYMFFSYKLGIINKVFGNDIIKKLTFGKISN